MRFIVLALFALFLAFSASANERVQLTQVQLTSGEWAPYLSKNLPYNGFASHIVSEAFSAVGIRVDYGFFPWERSLRYAKQGKGLNKVWQGSIVWIYSKEREKDFLFSDTVVSDTEVLFHLKSNPVNWQQIEDLKGKTIGGTQHTVYPTLETAENKEIIKIERAGDYQILFTRLLGRRIDAIPQVKAVGNYLVSTKLSHQQQAKVTFCPTPLESRNYHLMLNRKNKNNEQLMKLFNQGLAEIKQNGIYQRLLENFKRGTYR